MNKFKRYYEIGVTIDELAEIFNVSKAYVMFAVFFADKYLAKTDKDQYE